MTTWSLTALYNGYDETFNQDFATFEQKIETLDQLSQSLAGLEGLCDWLNLSSDLEVRAGRLAAFIHLNLATNTTDAKSAAYMGKLSQIASRLSAPHARFKAWFVSQASQFEAWCENELVHEHRFILQEILDQAQYDLNEEVENAISLMTINASNTWSNLQSHLTSTATIDFEGEMQTLSSIRNLAYESDESVRQKAYEKELALYPQIEDAVAFSLNSIKGQVNLMSKLRGYESPLQKTLIDSRMSEATLQALIDAIEEDKEIFRTYLKHKAKSFGKDRLDWHNLFAPYQLSTPKTYSIDESKTMIVESFADFSEDLSNLAKEAYENRWIDFLPRQGKRDGAFCANLPFIKQSRVLTNFSGSISDIITLAHELGHAYHGMMIEDNAILNTDYSMPVAETASTFCENIVLNAALKTASDEEKILLIENSLQDLTQITLDILSRYKFETEVLKRRNDEFLFAKDLKEIMLEAQKATYGEALATYHPYMWICKGHYYSAENNFYNFPYAFGGLFALGLYAQFEQEGAAFIPKYQNLLRMTPTTTCEEAAMLAGIDVTDKAFWKQSLALIKTRIDAYIELTQ